MESRVNKNGGSAACRHHGKNDNSNNKAFRNGWVCRQEECGTSFGLDEKCDATLCEADLCLSRHEECDTNLGLDEEYDST